MKATADRRQAILDAAQAQFFRLGYRGTSMEAIARTAGIAKPTLYAYFPDKAAVFLSLVERLVAEWSALFGAALGGEGDLVGRVGAALTAKHKAGMRLLEGSPHAAELYGEHDRLAAPQFRALEAGLAGRLEHELAAAGVARARFLAQLLLAASAGIAHRAQSPAELGPALRLVAERLIRPELP